MNADKSDHRRDAVRCGEGLGWDCVFGSRYPSFRVYAPPDEYLGRANSLQNP